MHKSKTRAYLAIRNAISRCHNTNDPAYHRYGGRGICVCDEWRESPIKFVEYMPEQGLADTLERIDNEKGYEPGNVKWATMLEQSRNRRTNVIINIDGKEMCLKDASEYLGLNYNTVKGRYGAGMSIEECLSTNLLWKNQYAGGTRNA